jgi:exodeoxyribonuclease VII large subunit
MKNNPSMKDNLTDSLQERKTSMHSRGEDPSALPGTRENPYSVSDLNRKVKIELEGQYSGIWLVGEISNFIAHRSRHYYFSLKDELSQIAVVMFYQANRKLKFMPEDGLEVLLYGKLSLYTPRGTYQIIVEEMEPKGIGSLQFAYDQLKKKLASEGLFDESRKQPIPRFPCTVGIITSPTGAAIKDLLRILEKITVRVLVFPSRVQGDEAAGEIIKGLDVLNKMTGIDLLILSRGGGSMEDLWPFNEEAVARAIASSHIPIITAIGHETDFTIADLASDVRASTPSAAAALIVQNMRDLESQLDQHLRSLTRESRIFVAEKRERISALMLRRGILGLEGMIKEKMQSADEYSRRLAASTETLLQNALSQWRLASSNLSFQRIQSQLLMDEKALQNTQTRLLLSVRQVIGNARTAFSIISGLLHSLSPLSILKRGYSVCRTAIKGKIVRRSSEVSEGQHIDVRLYKGSLLCEIKERSHDKKTSKT